MLAVFYVLCTFLRKWWHLRFAQSGSAATARALRRDRWSGPLHARPLPSASMWSGTHHEGPPVKQKPRTLFGARAPKDLAPYDITHN